MRRLRCERRIGELLRSRERGGVDPRLEIALHEVRAPDVHGERREAEDHDDENRRQDEHLPVLRGES